ncbi:MAG TPA: GTP cyclohydrolase I [Candidatus Sphingobacterium stercoripullorum]|nr:GTP cyclohydrolase I [Candidatus Sphingobacterium stercoripullorum]
MKKIFANTESLDLEVGGPLEGNDNLSDEQKIKKIQYLFGEIMTTLGLDLTDDSLKNTPLRVAKMYVKESFSGLNAQNKSAISLFKNS